MEISNKEDFDIFISELNEVLELDDRHTVIAIFSDNVHYDVLGWSVVEYGVKDNYPVYLTLRELFEAYNKNIDNYKIDF